MSAAKVQPSTESVKPAEALRLLAEQLRAEQTLISSHVREPEVPAELGVLVAAGPASASDATEYALVIEAVREGYLLHYGEPRIVKTPDEDLALLAGDYLYAVGLERLAALGNLRAVRLLADLISRCAQLHAEDRGAEADELWRRTAEAMAETAEGG